MLVQFRSFEFEWTSEYVFVRLPFVGQLLLGRRGPIGANNERVVFDSWATLKAGGEVR
jgi:hypothetical protein